MKYFGNPEVLTPMIHVSIRNDLMTDDGLVCNWQTFIAVGQIAKSLKKEKGLIQVQYTLEPLDTKKIVNYWTIRSDDKPITITPNLLNQENK